MYVSGELEALPQAFPLPHNIYIYIPGELEAIAWGEKALAAEEVHNIFIY
jgi:hypothetical protein